MPIVALFDRLIIKLESTFRGSVTEPLEMRSFKFQKRNGSISAFAKVVSSAAVSMVLLLVWLAADPEAHEHFHHDADKGEHQCVVTEFATGEGYYVFPQTAVPPVESGLGVAHFCADETIRETVAYVLLPICGPPSEGESF
jgi:hypothetical protein